MFENRSDAGQKLGAKLQNEPNLRHINMRDLLVLSIPRGGVIVGAEVAQRLGCAHEIVAAKKIGFPGREELALGAVAEDGVEVMDQKLLAYLHQMGPYIKQAVVRTKKLIAATLEKFRQGRPLDLSGKTVIVVDDGIATGETMQAAISWATNPHRPDRPRRVLAAVPVCAPQIVRTIGKQVDQFIYLQAPDSFWAVGQFYHDFRPVSDDEVIRTLAQVELSQNKPA